MNNKSKIAVFDSGVGGMHILTSLTKEFPNESFYFLADEGFFPYGTKTKEQLEDRITLIAKNLCKYDIKAIIIACNTASANSHHLVNIIDVPVIEIITATAKYALTKSPAHKIGVWATNATIASGCYQEVLETGAKCYPVKASALVPLIENNLITSEECRKEVVKDLELIEDADSLILGCTHFPLLTDEVKKLRPDLIQISSNVPVNVALHEYLDANNLANDENNKQTVELFTTDVNGTLKEKAKRFDVKVDSVEYLELK